MGFSGAWGRGGGWGTKHVRNKEEGKKGGVGIGIGIGIPIRAFLLPLSPSPFCAGQEGLGCQPYGLTILIILAVIETRRLTISRF